MQYSRLLMKIIICSYVEIQYRSCVSQIILSIWIASCYYLGWFVISICIVGIFFMQTVSSHFTERVRILFVYLHKVDFLF